MKQFKKQELDLELENCPVYIGWYPNKTTRSLIFIEKTEELDLSEEAEIKALKELSLYYKTLLNK